MSNTTSKTTQIILASASPRRAELLDQIGVRYRVQPAEINEDARPGETPENLVKRLAIEKSASIQSDLPVLGSDTLGVLDGKYLVKPRNFKHARQMLRSMSGNWHQILTAVAVTYQGKTEVMLNKNRVLFKVLSETEIRQYWQTGEPQDKAGAYAIQGLAAVFIKRIEGSYSGIMGLPLFETHTLLQQAGVKRIF